MKVKIIELDTDYGIKIIDDLKSKGWKQTKQYSPFAFDKGIDFDSYTLKKSGLKLKFEWCNWFEWEVTGSSNALESLAVEYSLKIEKGTVNK